MLCTGYASSRQAATKMTLRQHYCIILAASLLFLPKIRGAGYGGPKGSNTNQFTKTQNNFPKHESISQNTNQFTKTQINFPKHKSVYQSTKQFLKTQTNFPKHNSVYQNTNQFHKTQTNFPKHKSKDWALALSLSESLEGTHSQDFPRPTWRLLICCPFANVLPQLWV